jgi:hypothetical protein
MPPWRLTPAPGTYYYGIAQKESHESHVRATGESPGIDLLPLIHCWLASLTTNPPSENTINKELFCHKKIKKDLEQVCRHNTQ